MPQNIPEVDQRPTPAKRNDDLLTEFTFRDIGNDAADDPVNTLRQPTPAHKFAGIVEDDVRANWLRQMFYRLTDESGARLIGSDHLVGVDPDQAVDWIDDNIIDQVNAQAHARDDEC